jgi:DNA-binding GntR family transcriptional regulator
VRAEVIAELLSLSATPVREALHSLKVEGFLDLAPRRGFAVASLTADDIRDIFRAHALVAGELAARAAEKATPVELTELEGIHQTLLEVAARGDAELLEHWNHTFHSKIYRIAQSPRLLSILGTFTRYVPRSFYSQVDGWPKATERDHSAVLDALNAGDTPAARETMGQHLVNAGELLAEHVAQRIKPNS